MSRSKEGIFATLSQPNPIHTNGFGSTCPRITVNMFAHNGPAQSMDRRIHLILTPDEAVALASDLIGSLTPDMLKALGESEAIKLIQRLIQRYFRIIETPKKEG